MKNVLILFITFTLIGCAVSPVIKKTEKKVAKCYIGMPTNELQKLFGRSLKLERMSEEMTIYSIEKSYRTTWELGLRYYKFFYFENNKLVKIDEGQRAIDYRIKIDK